MGFYHKVKTDENPHHSYCPVGSKSWCKWRKSGAEGTLENFEHPSALDDELLKIMDVMGIKIGPQAEQLARKCDARRAYKADRQSTSDSREARTARKKAKSEEAEEYERIEGILYGSGIAD
ncbi:hypothetical protein CDAR_99441 [Caerostris darwini]|uniref:Uncharacterized protein n=1 Tax=Caerostris darwini TaxID=1538125 RepID=A0AAV4UMU8_9ARAC|nr:hypothetical protein CDAR_99441 [Caerostris darwini]